MPNDNMLERDFYRNGVAKAMVCHDEMVARTKATLANLVKWGAVQDKGAAEAKERAARRKAKYATWNGKPVVMSDPE
jgi:hypothetical protein